MAREIGGKRPAQLVAAWAAAIAGPAVFFGSVFQYVSFELSSPARLPGDPERHGENSL
jgi:hypothetical protein